MKKLSIVLILLFFTSSSFAQNEIRAGMGIDFINVPSLNDYINQSNFTSPNEELGSFNSAVNFSLEYGRRVSESYQVGVEVAYLLYSYTNTTINGKYEMAYDLIMPSLMNYYVVQGNGYNFKFGGGIGLRLLNADESLPAQGTTTTYTSTGFGFIIRCDGNTLLSDNLYANIGVDIRYDLNGEPENDGKKIKNTVAAEDVNFNSFSIGLHLGLSFFF